MWCNGLVILVIHKSFLLKPEENENILLNYVHMNIYIFSTKYTHTHMHYAPAFPTCYKSFPDLPLWILPITLVTSSHHIPHFILNFSLEYIYLVTGWEKQWLSAKMMRKPISTLPTIILFISLFSVGAHSCFPIPFEKILLRKTVKTFTRKGYFRSALYSSHHNDMVSLSSVVGFCSY